MTYKNNGRTDTSRATTPKNAMVAVYHDPAGGENR